MNIDIKIRKERKLKYSFFFICYLFMISHLSALNITTDVISLKIDKMPLLEVFSKIENKTDFNFFYKNDDINLNQRITIDIERVTIESLLLKLFKGRAILFKIEENIIILKKNVTASYLIKGLILDKKTGDPIFDVHLMVDDKKEGSLTNEQGVFEINFNALPITLTMSHINYGKRTVVIEELSEVTIALPPIINRLKAVSINSKEGDGKLYKTKDLSKNATEAEEDLFLFILPGVNFHFSEVNFHWDKSKGNLFLDAYISKKKK